MNTLQVYHTQIWVTALTGHFWVPGVGVVHWHDMTYLLQYFVSLVIRIHIASQNWPKDLLKIVYTVMILHATCYMLHACAHTSSMSLLLGLVVLIMVGSMKYPTLQKEIIIIMRYIQATPTSGDKPLPQAGVSHSHKPPVPIISSTPNQDLVFTVRIGKIKVTLNVLPGLQTSKHMVNVLTRQRQHNNVHCGLWQQKWRKCSPQHCHTSSPSQWPPYDHATTRKYHADWGHMITLSMSCDLISHTS